MNIRDTLERIKGSADVLAKACPPAPHACDACEIQFLANEALALLPSDREQRLADACRAMLKATGGSENWNGETHDALKLMESAL